MKEVKKCSLAGVAFTMDTDAYDTLEQYLRSLKKSYKDSSEGEEIVADIEARIAELILSTQSNDRVIEKPLILNIIQQMGTPEDITNTPDHDLHSDTPRIPRRLYRDKENAKLGGVCAGAGKYFDIDPVWIRMIIFVPFILTCLGWIPLLDWAGPMMGNLFGIIIICYLIMWFAVPEARSARQKLEMNGERITVQSIHHTSEATAEHAADTKAKSVIAHVVSLVGQMMIILIKFTAGCIVFGFIMAACALIICIFALIIGANEIAIIPEIIDDFNLWIPVLGLFIVLVPIALLIYVLMCLIASRKPGEKSIWGFFIIWILSIIAFTCIAIHEKVGNTLFRRHIAAECLLESKLTINGDTATTERILNEFGDAKVVEESHRSIHISDPSKQIDVTLDKKTGSINLKAAPTPSTTTKPSAPATQNEQPQSPQ